MLHKVAIVGAGPGGAAAALWLARRGVRDVILLDRDHFPRDKTCGSGLSPNALKVLDQLGVGPEVRRRGYPIDSLRLITPGNRELLVTNNEAAAVILLRREFDNLLVEGGQRLGVTLKCGFRATSLIREGGRVVGVRGKEGTKETEVRAEYVLCADGAHSIFSEDPRPKRTISTLMGWWEGCDFRPHTLEMIFDRRLMPLYGWLFPEGEGRVNLGICIDGQTADGAKQPRNVREVFQEFLEEHYGARLSRARQVGKWKGHPISHTNWIGHCTGPGVLYLGEAARITHHVTGEGIYQAMQSAVYAGDAIADVLSGAASEAAAWGRYTRRIRLRFTGGILMGHLLRAVMHTPLLDGLSVIYNHPRVRRAASWAIGSALAGHT